MTILSRADDSLLARWWWTVDRWLLLSLLTLLLIGLVLTFGASTPAAARLGLPAFHFATRQAVFVLLALGLMLGLSFLPAQLVRRAALVLAGVALLMTAATLVSAEGFNGARRWLTVGGLSLQPSEFLKPLLVVGFAWLIAGQIATPEFPGRLLALGLFGVAATLLLLQPDFGQTMLLAIALGLQFVLAGLPLPWMAGLGLGTAGLGIVGYLALPHVARRIDIFLDPSSGDTWQVDRALNAFRAGGLFGRGPGEGAVKKSLPEAHTDYIFAVAGEEFGALACLVILAMFAIIVLRSMLRLAEEEDPFTVLATSGLMALFGFQALINMAVNLALLPSKGMTLPFISYGGSSMLALGLTMGIVLALTRRNRFASRQRGLRWRSP